LAKIDYEISKSIVMSYSSEIINFQDEIEIEEKQDIQ